MDGLQRTLLSLFYILNIVCPVLLAAESFTCYSCTYTTSTDPTVTYDCVNNPTGVLQSSTTLTCTRSCYTRAIYTKDYSRIQSVFRGCFEQTEQCQGESCCNNYGPYPTCEYKCTTDECNNDNPEARLGTGSGKGDNEGGGASEAIYSLKLVLALASIAVFL